MLVTVSIPASSASLCLRIFLVQQQDREMLEDMLQMSQKSMSMQILWWVEG
jgi:hypothetical protein